MHPQRCPQAPGPEGRLPAAVAGDPEEGLRARLRQLPGDLVGHDVPGPLVVRFDRYGVPGQFAIARDAGELAGAAGNLVGATIDALLGLGPVRHEDMIAVLVCVGAGAAIAVIAADAVPHSDAALAKHVEHGTAGVVARHAIDLIHGEAVRALLDGAR